jgi:3,4-dihydroxy 2-butanone 4-phosphate synthase/GTP cyclohydrolase II
VIQALQQSNPTLTAGGQAILDRVEAVRDRKRLDPARPCITLSYAQSLDGCIAADHGLPTAISNCQTLVLTHHLRAMHDALLVGVNTVIVDDPRLTVRLAPGGNPTPVIVDSSLRMPLDAKLLGQDSRPLVATTKGAFASQRGALEEKGVDVVSVAANPDGGVDLADLFEMLRRRDMRSVFVEGGAKIITSILAADLADQVVLTIAPHFLGGVRSVEPLFGRGPNRRPGLTDIACEKIGDDLVVQGELLRSANEPK